MPLLINQRVRVKQEGPYYSAIGLITDYEIEIDARSSSKVEKFKVQLPGEETVWFKEEDLDKISPSLHRDSEKSKVKGGIIWVVSIVCTCSLILNALLLNKHIGEKTNTPEGAVRQFVNEYYQDANQVVLQDKSPTNGGYFIIVHKPNTKGYQLFYTTFKNGKWIAINTDQGYQRTSTYVWGGTFGPQKPNFVAVSTETNSKITKVVAYTRLNGDGKDIPFALSKVGNLPFWAYKYNVGTFNADYIVAYDSNGNVIWSSKHKS
ncbi:hypothetical protein [Alicyclobacillus mengziensis]|uniref:Uncharacterized protein n=1 Tax=Alicyclobacillus mengziensis TaxID=2931921 RepID=A0A9X7W1V8_9BACL|nr:hypothetical protein [Alicyclobacillus mengziensis]QSO49213.1 hypothetical protein JZ786_09995 [Alicyclobacillus mengziensis]